MLQVRLLAAIFLLAAPSIAQLGPLSSDTVGASPPTVAPPPFYSLSLDGDLDLGGFVFQGGAPFLHTYGAANTALGRNALISSTPGNPYGKSGIRNTALGNQALRANTSGYRNTASGVYALFKNTTGSQNTANGNAVLFENTIGSQNTGVGSYALFKNTSGGSNTAVGASALRNNTGDYAIANTAVGASALNNNTSGAFNTALGRYALLYNTDGGGNTAVGSGALLQNTTGDNNVALGSLAGEFNQTGSDNIWIGNVGADESLTLRIGGGQTRAFIAGIRNATGTFGQDVCVSVDDQLGPCSASSARFKEDIADLEADSEALFDLRPVRFRYREDFAGDDEERPVQYGLIAEEVAEIYPQLVTYDAEGKPMTVRYGALTPLLLNELKKERAELEEERSRNASQETELARLRADRAQLDQRVARLEALERSRETPTRK